MVVDGSVKLFYDFITDKLFIKVSIIIVWMTLKLLVSLSRRPSIQNTIYILNLVLFNVFFYSFIWFIFIQKCWNVTIPNLIEVDKI